MGLEIGGNFNVNTGGGMGGLDPLGLLGGNGAGANQQLDGQQGQNGMPQDLAKHLMSLCQQACGGAPGGGGAQGGGGCGGGAKSGGAEGSGGADGKGGAEGGGGIQQIMEMLMKLLQMLMGGGLGAQTGGAPTGATEATQPAA